MSAKAKMIKASAELEPDQGKPQHPNRHTADKSEGLGLGLAQHLFKVLPEPKRLEPKWLRKLILIVMSKHFLHRARFMENMDVNKMRGPPSEQ